LNVGSPTITEDESEGAAAEIRQLTLMLTHQPPAKPASPLRAVNPWMWIVLAVVAIGAAVVRWVG
jgi:hypothetical protein